MFYNGFLVHPHVIYETMEEINEQTESMKQIQDALSAPIGASADFDEVAHLPFRVYNLKVETFSSDDFIPTAMKF
jgi:hypothetical protein